MPTLIEPVEPQGGLVKAWSCSALDVFDNCAYATFLKRIKKVPEEQHPAAARGTEIHDLAEKYVDGSIGEEVPKELERYKQEFINLRENFNNGNVYLEGDWGFDINWNPTGWTAKDVWARMKLDACEYEDVNSVRVIDYKTGRKWGNELKHNRQAMTYAVGTFMRDPQVQFVTTEFWYLDQKDAPLTQQFTRNKIKIIRPNIDARAIRMTSATEFPPNPSKEACKWCSYAKNGTCEWAYQE